MVTKNRVGLDLWSEYAKAYDMTVTRTSFYGELREKALYYVNGSRNVLDVACGTGAYLERLAQEGKTAVGLDSNPAMLTYARAKLADYPGIDLYQAPADTYDVGAGAFDVALCMNALYAFPHPEVALQRIWDHLKPGGLVILTGPHPRSDPTVLVNACRDELRDSMGGEAFDYYLQIAADANRSIGVTMRRYTAGEVVDLLLGGAGFRDIVHADDNSYLSQSHFVVGVK